MEVINFDSLLERESELRTEFQQKKPFRWIVIEELLRPDAAWKIHAEFPPVDQSWVDSNGLHQKNKWTNPCVADTVAAKFFEEVNSEEFRAFLTRVTGIENVLRDPNLFGAGYHQVLDGGFLNVHVDFNKHDEAELDRRLNLLVYLNPEWQESYGGQLELWDMERSVRLEKVAPSFNRSVLFETNEVSYHGHPQPLNTEGKTTRKSLSVYYYTDGREDGYAAVPTHNTLYINTEGFKGTLKLMKNAVHETLRRNLHRNSKRR